MSKSFLLFLVIAAAVGLYLYKTNRFSDVEVSFDYTDRDISVTARGQDLHDCKLSLSNDFAIEIPFLRQNSRTTIGKDDFKQWNGTSLEQIKFLGPEIEFKLRCEEGGMTSKESNRYY